MSARQRGVALLLVLWACSLLAILLGSYAAMARLQALQAGVLSERTEAALAAESALARTLFLLLQAPRSRPSIRTDGAGREMLQDGYAVIVTVRDERGKIDLNQAAPEVIRRWLQASGGPAVPALADAVLGSRTRTRTGRRVGMVRLEDLAAVEGMTAERLQGLLPDATLWSGLSHPVLELASEAVLAAGSGMDIVAAREAIQRRLEQPPPAWARPWPGSVESLQARVLRDDRPLLTLALTVRLQSASDSRPYTVLRWQEAGMP